MKSITFFLSTALILLFSSAAYSQISQGGQPQSFSFPKSLSDNVPVKVMPAVDLPELMAQDSINDQNKEIPWRFGWNFFVDLGLSNSGLWEVLPNGDKLWRIRIKCPGAYHINLAFDDYHLPPGATFFEYNSDHSTVIGAFTDFNNRADSMFATTLVPGEEITMEYYEPKTVPYPGRIHLFRVTHGYRDAFGYAKSFGQSGSCNNNVHCPEAALWQNQVHSVCMLVSGGSGFCTGSLVNNTSQDGTPYILTANHCYSSPSTWVFWFNWESPTCTNPSGPPAYNSISGATLKAKNTASDFCLVQMSSVPPPSYGVYYAGWNKLDVAATSGAGIHHPSGDIKKISYSNQAFVSSTWSGTPANSHWQVFWSDGVTEPGSSGSPIFDQHRLVVGQLHGGPSACSASQLWDFYGKFSMSWNYGSTPSTRLKEWLDPTGIAGDTLHGWDPNAAPTIHTIDATNIGVDTATLNGTVNPNGILTQYHFDYGTSTAFGDTTASQSAGAGSSTIPVNAKIAGLISGVQYFFRLVGKTSTATYFGDTLTFTTIVPMLQVAPPNQNVGTPAGITTFFVTSNINWNVSSAEPWCTVTPSGTGNDTIFAGFEENTSISPRVAQITVTGTGVASQVVTVSQEGVPIILDVAPPNRDVVYEQGNTSFYVTSNTSWNVISNAGWITYSVSGTGNDSILVQFATNQDTAARVAEISVYAIGHDTVKATVTQAGTPLTLAVTPPNQNVTYPSGATTFTVTSNAAWIVSSNASWCTVPASGSGNETIQATYTENPTNAPRIALIHISVPGHLLDSVTVTQAKNPLGIEDLTEKDFRLVPNPSQGKFTIIPAVIINEPMEIRVSDMNGKIVWYKQFSGEKEYVIDLGTIPDGLYQVILQAGKNPVVIRIIIRK